MSHVKKYISLLCVCVAALIYAIVIFINGFRNRYYSSAFEIHGDGPKMLILEQLLSMLFC